MKTIIAAAAALTLTASQASATVIDFALEADTNGERGLDQGDALSIAGVTMSLYAIEPGIIDEIDASPYLDAGRAGLGVCSMGLTATDQCVVPSDDNVTAGEGVGIIFEDGLFDISGLVFRGANHALLGTDAMITIGTVGDASLFDIRTDTIGAFVALAAAGDAFFSDVRAVGFGFAGDQFYLSALDVDPSAVPLPAGALLFLTGAGGLLARRKLTA